MGNSGRNGHLVKLKITGKKHWYRSEAIANDYFEAIVLAFSMLDGWPEAEAAQIVPRPAHEA